LPSWIRIRIPNTDPDPQTRLNPDPIRIRIRIHNTDSKLGAFSSIRLPLIEKILYVPGQNTRFIPITSSLCRSDCLKGTLRPTGSRSLSRYTSVLHQILFIFFTFHKQMCLCLSSDFVCLFLSGGKVCELAGECSGLEPVQKQVSASGPPPPFSFPLFAD
jgi:hypothetical protein